MHEAGAKVGDLIRKHVIPEQRFYRLKSKYDGTEVREVSHLKELESKNARVKRLLAEADLNEAPREEVRESTAGKTVSALRSEYVVTTPYAQRPICRYG